MKKLIALVLAISLTMSLISCSNSDNSDTSKLLGCWDQTDYPGYTFFFMSDMTGSVVESHDRIGFTWKIENELLIITYERTPKRSSYKEWSCTYTLDDSALKIVPEFNGHIGDAVYLSKKKE